MKEVSDGIFLGDAAIAEDEKMLTEKNINLIINLGSHKRTYKEVGQHACTNWQKFDILYICIEDNNSSDILPLLPITNLCIALARKKGKNVFVHWYIRFHKAVMISNAGISRSPSIIIAYLIQCVGLSYEDAFEKLKSISDRRSMKRSSLLEWMITFRFCRSTEGF